MLFCTFSQGTIYDLSLYKTSLILALMPEFLISVQVYMFTYLASLLTKIKFASTSKRFNKSYKDSFVDFFRNSFLRLNNWKDC